MAWPTPQDYNEALQNPRFCFADSQLRDGEPQLTRLGLPRPITGNFASVYRLHTANKDWAVRCFWREYADMQDRYAALSQCLRTIALPYTVGFEYLPRGVQIRGSWFPVLKMEWVEGMLLGDYVEQNRHDPKALEQLAGQWAAMILELERAGIAHGDLQHGNVLVTNGQLRLVDYDGMYVPQIAGLRSHELGHPNYQHPRRGGADFGPYLDRFAAWVIYLSLRALVADPGLWDQLSGGDECLLLRRADFELLPMSALHTLQRHPDPEVSRLAGRVAGFLATAPARVPSLVEVTSATTGKRPRRGLFGRIEPDMADATNVPDWVIDHLRPETVPQPPFAASKLMPRVLAVLSALGLAPVAMLPLAAEPLPMKVLPLGLLLAAAGTLIGQYSLDGEVATKRAILSRARSHGRALRRVERRVARQERRLNRKRAAHAAALTRIEACRQALERTERERKVAMRSTFDQCLSMLQQRLEAERSEETAVRRQALSAIQEAFVSAALQTTTLRRARLVGFGTMLRLRLRRRGIRRASDVSAERVAALRWLDARDAVTLVAWRVEVERTAKNHMPRKLTEPIDAAVSRRYAKRYASLTADLELSGRRRDDVLQQLGEGFRCRRERLDARRERLDDALLAAEQRIAAEIAVTRRDEPVHSRYLGEARRELAGYIRVTPAAYLRAVFLPWLA